MSINRTMQSGVSGLAAESSALGVVGDNIANTNTVGFKQSRSIFEDILGSAVGGSTDAVGAGVRMARTQQIFAQGSLVNTGLPTDLALSGDGFFVVHGSVDGRTGDFYTRAGQTTLRSDGTLVDPSGLPLQGYGVDANGAYTSAITDVKLGSSSLSPKPTSKVTITANLDASSKSFGSAAFDPKNAATTSNFSTTTTVYDSLGKSHSIDVYFVKVADNTWQYNAVADGAELAQTAGGQPITGPTAIQSGTLTFSLGGTLTGKEVTGVAVAGAQKMPVSFKGAEPGQMLEFDFGEFGVNGAGASSTTQFAAASNNIAAQKQDGYPAGDISGVKIDPDGTVRGVYTNGEALAVAKLAVAKFRSNDGLSRAGHNLWTASVNSGEAALGVAGAGGRATLVAGALEQSNVDIASQFTDLISHQRSFQANSKTISTADQMLQELMNIKN
jgi:flagellar hook protein FlgE